MRGIIGERKFSEVGVFTFFLTRLAYLPEG